jgi:hypothetical protein
MNETTISVSNMYLSSSGYNVNKASFPHSTAVEIRGKQIPGA